MPGNAKTAAIAAEAAARQHAMRAIDNPVKLAWAARIVRVAIARGRLSANDLVNPSDVDAAA